MRSRSTWRGFCTASDDDGGDVLGHERLGHVVVDGVGPSAVPAEPHERELVGLHHAGRHLDDAQGLAVQLEPQHLGQRVGGELGRVVPAPAGVGRVPGDRRDVHDVGDPALHGAPAQQREQRARDPLQGEHVDLEHPGPVVDRRRLDRVEALRAARVVHERVQRAGRGEVVAQGVDVGLVGQVRDEHGCPGLLGELPQPILAAGDADHVPSGGPERAHGRRSDPGARTGHDRSQHIHAPHCGARPGRRAPSASRGTRGSA